MEAQGGRVEPALPRRGPVEHGVVLQLAAAHQALVDVPGDVGGRHGGRHRAVHLHPVALAVPLVRALDLGPVLGHHHHQQVSELGVRGEDWRLAAHLAPVAAGAGRGQGDQGHVGDVGTVDLGVEGGGEGWVVRWGRRYPVGSFVTRFVLLKLHFTSHLLVHRFEGGVPAGVGWVCLEGGAWLVGPHSPPHTRYSVV